MIQMGQWWVNSTQKQTCAFFQRILITVHIDILQKQLNSIFNLFPHLRLAFSPSSLVILELLSKFDQYTGTFGIQTRDQ